MTSESHLEFRPGQPRSVGAIPHRRVPQEWPKGERFRILSIDGGGIRGIFPAAVLADLERRYSAGGSIASYFDLIVGTSTGGIVALGLGAGYSACDLLDLYVRRGNEIFPPFPDNVFGRTMFRLQRWWHYAHYLYDREALKLVLTDQLGARLLGDSTSRLCIPSFDGKHSEVFVFKTPHHPDYKFDRFERMTDVALATSAAPSYFRPLEHGRYVLVDGGVWANNPTMIGILEALTCFDVDRSQIDVLTLGCGDDRYVVSAAQITKGGLWYWKDIMLAAMRLQSLSATNQARLLLGAPAIVRVDSPTFEPKIELDDWRRSIAELIPAAAEATAQEAERISQTFLGKRVSPYKPTIPSGVGDFSQDSKS